MEAEQPNSGYSCLISSRKKKKQANKRNIGEKKKFGTKKNLQQRLKNQDPEEKVYFMNVVKGKGTG